MPTMRRGGVVPVSDVGVLGDPMTATAAAGECIFDAMVKACAERVRRWGADADGMLR